MPNPKMTSRVENERTLVLERTFDAPQAMVFKAYSKAEHLKHWWGPRSMKTVHCEIDARPGGSWAIHQVVDAPESIGGTPGGTLLKFKGKILEVDPPNRLVQTFGMEGEWGDQEIREVVTLTGREDQLLRRQRCTRVCRGRNAGDRVAPHCSPVPNCGAPRSRRREMT